MVRFSVTKEVGYERGDEPGGGELETRYRFSVDISRTSKPKAEKKDSARPKSPKGHAKSRGHRNNHSHRHVCCGCGKTRCGEFQEQYPLKDGSRPPPNLCTACRYERKERLENNTSDDNHLRKPSELQEYIDDHHWCNDCGRARSDNYHEMYRSGNLPPWLDKCKLCVKTSEKKQDCARLRMYEEEIAGNWSRSDEILNDPLCDSLRHRRSSPYALAPNSSRLEFFTVSPKLSVSDLPAETGQLSKFSRGQQASVESFAASDTSSLTTSSSAEIKASDDQSIRVNSRNATVETYVSDDDDCSSIAASRKMTRDPGKPQTEKHTKNHEQQPKQAQPLEITAPVIALAQPKLSKMKTFSDLRAQQSKKKAASQEPQPIKTEHQPTPKPELRNIPPSISAAMWEKIKARKQPDLAESRQENEQNYGNIYGDVHGTAFGAGNGMGYANVYGNVYGDVHGNAFGAGNGMGYANVYGEVYGDVNGASYGNDSTTYPSAYPNAYFGTSTSASHAASAPAPVPEPHRAEKRVKAKKPVDAQVWEVDSNEEEEIEERHARLVGRKGRVARV
ncbi:hypothetical protein N0V88_004417 [Collariella sp. IMI 366227]|nr:hypothetical protein N0V88_004417 [Collariella sp. IMI 366227]